MNGKILKVGELKQAKNFVPLPYRCVSYQPYEGVMTEESIRAYLLSKEVYRRTDIIILHNRKNEYSVVAVQRASSDTLFGSIDDLEVLALPDTCVFIVDANVDPANRSSLAKLAFDNNISSDQTLVVTGKFDHINMIHHPEPLVLRVVEVAPPEPPKLYSMIEHVLSYADLPPIIIELERIDLLDLCKTVKPKAYLVPCRSGGLDDLDAPVFFLDERPAERQNWTLIGCERSLQFHRHYYGDEPPRVEICPRKIANDNGIATILKCCLLEFDIEQVDNIVTMPWGVDLTMVESALKKISAGVVYV